MILDSKKWKNMEELLNRGKTKTSPGFLASANDEFSSKKKWNSLQNGKRFLKEIQGNLMKQILKTHVFLGNSTI